MTASLHFKQRVAERIGPDIDADLLARSILHDVQHGIEDRVKYVGRVSRCGRRVFQVNLPERNVFYALVNTVDMACLTVLPPNFLVRREKGNTIVLNEGQSDG